MDVYLFLFEYLDFKKYTDYRKKYFLARVFVGFVTWSTGTFIMRKFLWLGTKMYGHCAQYPENQKLWIFVCFATSLTCLMSCEKYEHNSPKIEEREHKSMKNKENICQFLSKENHIANGTSLLASTYDHLICAKRHVIFTREVLEWCFFIEENILGIIYTVHKKFSEKLWPSLVRAVA